ncbi:MAG: ABC transporter ATP-binding protein [Minisyncoccia bacterium]
MNYKLNMSETESEKGSLGQGLRKLWALTAGEGRNLFVSLAAILVSSASSLAAPFIIGYTIDHFIATKDFHGVLVASCVLLAVYIVGGIGSYVQTLTMGGIGIRILFKLRNSIFNKLQELPIVFFNQNKSGDLISRINNDTQKLNQLFAESLTRFIGGLFTLTGTGIFLIVLNWRLGIAALLPALMVTLIVRVISPWVQARNLKSLQSLGGMSAEIQESLKNFKAMIAFNRLDYFREKFNESNTANYRASIGAGVANNLFGPMFDLSYDLGQLIVLAYGIYLISSGIFTVGLLISFLIYTSNFYNPLRQFASVWSSVQLALAGLQRITDILNLESDMPIVPSKQTDSPLVLEFKDVSFHYPDGTDILKNINLKLEKGKTYALVGPTGGGKTTTASLMARLYDPTKGSVFFQGKDIRAYESAERAQKIGYLLQEPFLFTGTVRDNIVYGNAAYLNRTSEELAAILKDEGLANLLERFEGGLDTEITSGGETISLGQKQLIAFIRAVLRSPELLILDEATANIDTVTEKLLEDILNKLPATTTKVVIAHRLNTISDADEIYFVNSGEITSAGSMQHALDLLLHGKRES